MTNTTQTTDNNPILVTGVTGRTGHRIAARLTAAGAPVRGASRTTTTSGDTVRFDWEDESTWRPALVGVRAVYVCYAPDLAFPGVPELMSRFFTTVAEIGVPRAVLLSGRGEPAAEECERLLAATVPEWAVVRCAWFAQNFSENFLQPQVRRGRILLPADPDIGEPFVDLDDVADAATAALLAPSSPQRVIELTGPEALTLPQVAATLTTATGRQIEFRPSSVEEFVADVATDGVPEDDARGLAMLFTDILDGRNSTPEPSDPILGRSEHAFSEYAQAAAEAWK